MSFKCRWCPATYSTQEEADRHEESRWLHYPDRLAALSSANRALVDALQTLLAGTRDPDAHGMGETLQAEYPMPPSTNKRVRKLIKEALASHDAGAGREDT